MSIYVGAKARFTGLEETPTDFSDAGARRILESALAPSLPPGLEFFKTISVHTEQGMSVFDVNLIPLGVIRLTMRPGSGIFELNAPTTPSGPGFHAMASNFVRNIGERKNLDLIEVYDETGFHETGDFADLKLRMQKWVKNLFQVSARKLASSPENGDAVNQVRLCLPVGLEPVTEDVIVSHVGPVPADALAGMVGKDSSEIETQAADFCVWWERDVTPLLYYKALKCLLWTWMPWHPPADDAERRLYRIARECMRRVRGEKNLAFPKNELDEIASLEKTSPEEFVSPYERGVGYRRRYVIENLGVNWRMLLPGYFYSGVRESALCFNNAKVYVRFKSMAVNDSEGRKVPADRLIEDMKNKFSGGDADKFEHYSGGMMGCAERTTHEEDGVGFYLLEASNAVDGNLALTTIAYSDETMHDWVVETWKSLEYIS